MGQLLTSGAGVIFTQALSNAGTVASTIVSEPLLLLGCLIPVAFLGVNLFRKLFNM